MSDDSDTPLPWARHLRPTLRDVTVYDVPPAKAPARLHANECPEPWPEDVTDALLGLSHPFELLFVDDGSSDRTPEILADLASKEDSIKVIRLRRNFGQTAALMAGLDHARGSVIVVMDGDGQNDPADIPLLLDELAREENELERLTARWVELEEMAGGEI